MPSNAHIGGVAERHDTLSAHGARPPHSTIALMQGPVRAERSHHHVGLVVDNRATVRELAQAAGAQLRLTRCK